MVLMVANTTPCSLASVPADRRLLCFSSFSVRTAASQEEGPGCRVPQGRLHSAVPSFCVSDIASEVKNQTAAALRAVTMSALNSWNNIYWLMAHIHIVCEKFWLVINRGGLSAKQETVTKCHLDGIKTSSAYFSM
jgi:hypothetical protein